MTWHLIPLRAATLLPGSIDRVHRSIRRVDVWERAAGALGLSLEVATEPGPLWSGGEVIRVRHRTRKTFGNHGSWLGRIEVVDALPVLTVLTGSAKGAQARFRTGATGAGTLVTVELLSTEGITSASARLEALAQAPRRPAAVLALRTLLGIITLAVHENVVVVGAAIISGGALLAARRSYPAKHAGKWELPGGKVEPGESDQLALVREVNEELGVTIAVQEQLGGAVPLDVELELRIYRAVVVAGDPAATEHDELRWVTAAELRTLDWLEGDRAFLDHLFAALSDASA